MKPDARALTFLAASAAQVRADENSFAHTVPSPCLSVCQMDASTGLCLGCLRTLDEIARWGAADDAFRRAVWSRIGSRVEQLKS